MKSPGRQVLTEKDLVRYGRQIHPDGWGEEAQRILKASTVFVAGCGGLGSPVATYLAMAGVGKLILCDDDRTELSNLNRQFLHREDGLDENKALSAARTIGALNSDIEIEPIVERIDAGNIDGLAAGADLIVDCLDNFKTRMVLNDYSVRRAVPMIFGSIHGMEGMVTTLVPPRTACLACIFQKPPPGEVPPVLGPAPGVVGAIQSAEAVKLLTAKGTLLTGRLLVCNLSEMRFEEFKVAQDPGCAVCGNIGPDII